MTVRFASALLVLVSLRLQAEPLSRDVAPASARTRAGGWWPKDRRANPPADPSPLAGDVATPVRPRPVLPEHPIPGDWPEGYPVSHGVTVPSRAPSVDPAWPRSAVEARWLVVRLPADQAQAVARLEHAIVIMTARHGRVFEEARFKALVEKQPWYVPSPHYSMERLSQGEREALDILLQALERRRSMALHDSDS